MKLSNPLAAILVGGMTLGMTLLPTGAEAQSASHVAQPQTVSSGFCDGKGKSKVVKKYYRGKAAYPLRCGTSAWGFVHLVDKKRWGKSLDSGITLTFAYGENAVDEQGDGGSNIWELFDNNCNLLFTVIYNADAYNGNSFKPQGVITAYPVSDTAVQRGKIFGVRGKSASPDYGSDCPIFQNI